MSRKQYVYKSRVFTQRTVQQRRRSWLLPRSLRVDAHAHVSQSVSKAATAACWREAGRAHHTPAQADWLGFQTHSPSLSPEPRTCFPAFRWLLAAPGRLQAAASRHKTSPALAGRARPRRGKGHAFAGLCACVAVCAPRAATGLASVQVTAITKVVLIK